MSNYDYLAELQLRGDMAKDPADIINDLALHQPTKPTSAVGSPTKRKRAKSTTVEPSPSKRRKGNMPREPFEQVVIDSPKPPRKKLGRPKKGLSRDLADPSPVMEESKEDPYEFEGSNMDKLVSKCATHGKMPKSRTAPKKAAPVSASDTSSPIAKSPVANKQSTQAIAPAEVGNGLHTNGTVDLTKKSSRKTGSAKEQGKPSGQGEHSARTKDQGPSKLSKAPRPVYGTRSNPPATKKKSLKKTPQDDFDEDRDDVGSEQQKSDGSEEADVEQGEEPEDSSGEQSDHDRSLQDGGDCEAIEETMDLFGEERNWEKVLESARSVREHGFSSKTETIRDLLEAIKRARSTYRQLASLGEGNNGRIVKLNDELHDELEGIEERIENITEADAGKKRSDLIRDVFARAIPAMVFLLESALLLRTSQSHGLHRYSALQEVIRLQDILLQVCMKAKAWKVKPTTGLPIVKPAVSVILPYIRNMRDGVFVQELRRLERHEKIKANAEKTKRREQAQSQREAATLSQQTSQGGLTQIGKGLAEEKEKLLKLHKRRPVPVIRDVVLLNDQPAKQRNNTTAHEWSEQETMELIVQLERSGDLCGERRWTYILDNSKILQELLPDHVRERALALKPLLMEDPEAKGAFWVENIT